MKEASPHARGPAIQRRDSKCGFNSKSLAMETPSVAQRAWPRMEARGWARGEVMVL